MKLIFEKSLSGALLVYIHCLTAKQQYTVGEKLFRHSEYTTKWDELCDEWIEKKWFQYVNKEELVGRDGVITSLIFVDGRNDDLIKELSKYFEDEYVCGGYYNIEYQSFKTESND
jgi:hypothetical protein